MDALSACIDTSVSGLTYDRLRTMLLDNKLPQKLVDGIIAELENCDYGRFAPSATKQKDLLSALKRTEEILLQLARLKR